jgi:2-polyprenyl-6-methoxyphenol hydroxylase-like FAD-dependent oxidoreductase
MNDALPAIATIPIYDVIISGAGPVGLFLACELALTGCSVLILEQRADTDSPLKRLPFGMRGLNTLSISSFERRGLLQELRIHELIKMPHAQAATQPAKATPGGHFAGIQFPGDKIRSSQWPYYLPGPNPPMLLSEMAELETVLSRRAATLGVDILCGQAVSGYEQDESGVQVLAGGQSFRAGWLLGCDGSRSAVRKAGGFEFAGTEPKFTGYTMLADIAEPELLRPGRNVTATGMYMQSQPGYIILQDFDGGAFHKAGAAVTREHAEVLLQRISGTGVRITALHLATTWTDRARQAMAYRKGRVLLAGDAAHIHSPLGGQGLNLGLGDAMNLGWKLAAVIHGNAPETILESYEAERMPVGEQVLEWSRAQVAVMRPEPHSAALRAIVSDLIQTADGATYFAGRTWGIYTKYDAGGEHPMAGHSAPDFELEGGMRLNGLMQAGGWMLLDFRASAALQELAAAWRTGIRYVSTRAEEELGLSAVLIRPDGFVAWAAEGTADAGDIEQVLERWLVK